MRSFEDFRGVRDTLHSAALGVRRYFEPTTTSSSTYHQHVYTRRSQTRLDDPLRRGLAEDKLEAPRRIPHFSTGHVVKRETPRARSFTLPTKTRLPCCHARLELRANCPHTSPQPIAGTSTHRACGLLK